MVGHALLCFGCVVTRVLVESEDAATVVDGLAQRHHDFRRTFAVKPAPIPVLNDDRHTAAVAVEGDFSAQAQPVRRGLSGRFMERHLHRIAEPGRSAVAQLGLETVTSGRVAQ